MAHRGVTFDWMIFLGGWNAQQMKRINSGTKVSCAMSSPPSWIEGGCFWNETKTGYSEERKDIKEGRA